MKSIKFISLIFLFILKTNLLYSKEISLFEIAKEELFFLKGASLWEEPLSESPAPSMIYLSDHLKRFGFNNIRDFLEYLPSFYLIQDVNERVIAWRGLYTTSSNAFLFLEEGQRLDLPAFGNFLLDASYPLKDISKIEVISGPTSSLYGTNGLSGVIQTERRPVSPFSLSGSIGEYDEKEGSLSLAYKDFYGLFHYGDLPSEEIKETPIHPRRDNLGLIFKGHLYRLPFQLFYFKNEYNTPRSQGGYPLSSLDRSIYGSYEKGELLVLNFKKTLNFDKFSLHLQPSYTHFKAKTPQVRIPASLGGPQVLDILLENERYAFLSYVDIPLSKGLLLLGTDLNKINHLKYKSKLFNGTAEKVYTLPKEEEFNYALFCQYKHYLGDFIFHLGFRYDNFELWGERFSPRLALNWNFKPFLTFQINYSEAFNAPSYFYATANPVIGYGSASNLKPEVLKNWSLSSFYYSQALKGRVTFYLNELKDKIGYDSKQRVYTNLKKFKTAGLETEWLYQEKDWLAFLNYSLLSILEGKGLPIVHEEERIIAIPKWMLKGGLSYKVSFIQGLSLAPMFRWYGKAFFKDQEIPSYALWDLNLLYEKNKFNLNFKVENIFDKHYKRAGTLPPIPWQGRTFRVGAEIFF